LKTTVTDAEDGESEDEDARKIKEIVFDDYIIGTWYDAPYPEEYTENSTLNICEFCMKYLKSDVVAYRHKVRKHIFML
jgi:histone acetyltransferase SAS3